MDMDPISGYLEVLVSIRSVATPDIRNFLEFSRISDLIRKKNY